METDTIHHPTLAVNTRHRSVVPRDRTETDQTRWDHPVRDIGRPAAVRSEVRST